MVDVLQISVVSEAGSLLFQRTTAIAVIGAVVMTHLESMQKSCDRFFVWLNAANYVVELVVCLS